MKHFNFLHIVLLSADCVSQKKSGVEASSLICDGCIIRVASSADVSANPPAVNHLSTLAQRDRPLAQLSRPRYYSGQSPTAYSLSWGAICR